MTNKQPLKRKYSLTFKEPSLTKQSFKDEANINKIMARYEQTGQLPNASNKTPQYGDFTNITDYQDALHKIEESKKTFSELSAETRKFFDNNPANFLEFASNPENLPKLRELGLAPTPTPKTEEKPLKTQPIPSQKEVEIKK